MFMKKINLILFLCAVSSITFGQLKVIGSSPNSGSVSIGYTGYSNIWLGSQPNSVLYSGFDTGKWGIEVWGENLNIWKPWPSPNNGQVNYYMFLTPSGAIGIGQVPTHSGICLDVNGKIYSSGIELTSDEHLKTNIKPLTNKIDKLYLLNGKSYAKFSKENEVSLSDIKDEKGNVIKKYEKFTQKKLESKEEFGFLAQELKEIYPELVNRDTLGYYYVNYIGLIPVLVEAIKQQKTLLESLSNQLKAISSQSNKAPAFAPMKQSKNTKENIPITLYQNNPNPFSQSTQIKYYLPETVNKALLCIYDLQGKQLKQITIAERGEGSQTINGAEFSAGIYLYGLIADGQQVDVRRMVLTD